MIKPEQTYPQDDKRQTAVYDTCQNNKDIVVATKFYMVRSKVFNFYNVSSVLNAKQNPEMYEFNLDTGSNVNLMPIRKNKCCKQQNSVANLQ